MFENIEGKAFDRFAFFCALPRAGVLEIGLAFLAVGQE